MSHAESPPSQSREHPWQAQQPVAYSLPRCRPPLTCCMRQGRPPLWRASTYQRYVTVSLTSSPPSQREQTLKQACFQECPTSCEPHSSHPSQQDAQIVRNVFYQFLDTIAQSHHTKRRLAWTTLSPLCFSRSGSSHQEADDVSDLLKSCLSRGHAITSIHSRRSVIPFWNIVVWGRHIKNNRRKFHVYAQLRSPILRKDDLNMYLVS